MHSILVAGCGFFGQEIERIEFAPVIVCVFLVKVATTIILHYVNFNFDSFEEYLCCLFTVLRA